MKKKETIIAAFYTQKGGSGKTTITHMMSISQASQELDISVIDCDPQRSLVKAFENIRNSKEDPNFKPPYELSYCPITGLTKLLEEQYGKYDVIWVDLPGTMDMQGVKTALLALDVIFIPIQPSQLDMSSAEDTILQLQDIQKFKRKEGGDLQYYCFVNQAEPKKISTKDLIEYISTTGIGYLENPMLRYEKYKYLLNDYEDILKSKKWGNEEHTFSKFFDEVKSKISQN